MSCHACEEKLCTNDCFEWMKIVIEDPNICSSTSF